MSFFMARGRMLLLVLLGTFLTLLALAAGMVGNLYAAMTIAATIPLSGMIAAFRSLLSPVQVAVSLCAPLTLISAAIVFAEPWSGSKLSVLGVPLAAFLFVLFAAHIGRWRRRAIGSAHADA
jgi:hypothetical protein